MEPISIFDILKIGVGPSSSHTMGPWKACLICLSKWGQNHELSSIREVRVQLFGSLAKTGKGHGTDFAIIMGLAGYEIESVSTKQIKQLLESVDQQKRLMLLGKHLVDFDPYLDIIYLTDQSLDFHPNGMTIQLCLHDESTFEETFFSIGGGFVVKEGEKNVLEHTPDLPYSITSSEELLHYTHQTGKKLWEIIYENELCWRTQEEIDTQISLLWQTMLECMYQGCHTEGRLPGGLGVMRRAFHLNKRMIEEQNYTDALGWMTELRREDPSFRTVLKWVSCFALAVNEQNAAFGKVVTAPTNGAAGVIPAVLMYLLCFCEEASENMITRFMLVAGEVGSLFKKGATISAALGGCQAEIGVSSAMAAAGLTACLGGSAEQVLMASEIAMEHHLGLTCDPIGGLVQIPCIERNSMGAIKAITASNIALESDPSDAKVSLDTVIKAMWDTAQDMHVKYKETSEGGLAVHIPVNLSEC